MAKKSGNAVRNLFGLSWLVPIFLFLFVMAVFSKVYTFISTNSTSIIWISGIALVVLILIGVANVRAVRKVITGRFKI